MRLFISYSFTFSVASLSYIIFRIREFSFFSLMEKCESQYTPGFLGSAQDILTLLDVMLVTARYLGLSGKTAIYREKVQIMTVKCVINNYIIVKLGCNITIKTEDKGKILTLIQKISW